MMKPSTTIAIDQLDKLGKHRGADSGPAFSSPSSGVRVKAVVTLVRGEVTAALSCTAAALLVRLSAMQTLVERRSRAVNSDQ